MNPRNYIAFCARYKEDFLHASGKRVGAIGNSGLETPFRGDGYATWVYVLELGEERLRERRENNLHGHTRH
jgi:hypothetical protein